MDKNYAQLSIDHEKNEQQMDFDEYGYTKDSNDNDMIIITITQPWLYTKTKMTTMEESFQTLKLLKR